MALLRSAWMRRMLQRDVRVMDSMLLGHLIGSVSFFASTTVLLLAGFIGVLAAAEDAHQVVADLGFTVHTAKALFELKLVLLLGIFRSEEHTSELQSLMRTSYAVFCLIKKKKHYVHNAY